MKLASCLLCITLLAAHLASGAETGIDNPPSFEQHVRPIFKAHCFQCHGEEGQRKGGLDLRLKRLIDKGGDSGLVILPGKPTESPLVEKIRSGEMPPVEKKLSAVQIETIVRWIAAGAQTLHAEPEHVGDGPILVQKSVGIGPFSRFASRRRQWWQRLNTYERRSTPSFWNASSATGSPSRPKPTGQR